MADFKRIMLIAIGTCLGHILFAILTWAVIAAFGISLFSVMR